MQYIKLGNSPLTVSRICLHTGRSPAVNILYSPSSPCYNKVGYQRSFSLAIANRRFII